MPAGAKQERCGLGMGESSETYWMWKPRSALASRLEICNCQLQTRPTLPEVLVTHVTGNSDRRALLLLGEGDDTSDLRIALEYSYSLLIDRAGRRKERKTERE